MGRQTGQRKQGTEDSVHFSKCHSGTMPGHSSEYKIPWCLGALCSWKHWVPLCPTGYTVQGCVLLRAQRSGLVWPQAGWSTQFSVPVTSLVLALKAPCPQNFLNLWQAGAEVTQSETVKLLAERLPEPAGPPSPGILVSNCIQRALEGPWTPPPTQGLQGTWGTGLGWGTASDSRLLLSEGPPALLGYTFWPTTKPKLSLRQTDAAWDHYTYGETGLREEQRLGKNKDPSSIVLTSHPCLSHSSRPGPCECSSPVALLKPSFPVMLQPAVQL